MKKHYDISNMDIFSQYNRRFDVMVATSVEQLKLIGFCCHTCDGCDVIVELVNVVVVIDLGVMGGMSVLNTREVLVARNDGDGER